MVAQKNERAYLSQNPDDAKNSNVLPFISQSPIKHPAQSPFASMAAPPQTELTSASSKGYSKDYIRSYTDILTIQEYFLQQKQYRNLMIFNLGLATGLRISDILSLKIYDVLEPDNITYKAIIDIYERKTGKRTVSQIDAVTLTEICIISIDLYLNSINRQFRRDDYLASSQKENTVNHIKRKKNGQEIIITRKGDKVLNRSSVYRIFQNAQEDLDLPYTIGTHTLRRTFSCATQAIAENSNMNLYSPGKEIAQRLLRHKSISTTDRYSGRLFNESIQIRKKLSDFLRGKTLLDDISGNFEFYI